MSSKFTPAIVAAISACKDADLRSYAQLNSALLFKIAEVLEEMMRDEDELSQEVQDNNNKMIKKFCDKYVSHVAKVHSKTYTKPAELMAFISTKFYPLNHIELFVDTYFIGVKTILKKVVLDI